jgi:hypothetical protein
MPPIDIEARLRAAAARAAKAERALARLRAEPEIADQRSPPEREVHRDRRPRPAHHLGARFSGPGHQPIAASGRRVVPRADQRGPTGKLPVGLFAWRGRAGGAGASAPGGQTPSSASPIAISLGSPAASPIRPRLRSDRHIPPPRRVPLSQRKGALA